MKRRHHTQPASRGRPRERRSARLARIPSRFRAALLALCVLALRPVAAQDDASSEAAVEIERTRTALEKWVETKRLISKEKRDLALSREMLEERIALVQREIDGLREKIAEAEKSIEEADSKRIELVQENDTLKEASAFLGDLLASLEKRTLALLSRLPEPVRQRVKPLSQRLPEKPEECELSLSQRFQNVVGILNQVNKENRNIAVASEVRSLPDGDSAEVTAVYVGLGQGYYTGGAGRYAGVGRPTAEGWEWKASPDAAAAIAQVIAILKNEAVAAFVPLPVEVE